MKKLFILMLAVLMVLTMTACSNKKLYGTWYEENGYLEIEIGDELVLHDYVWSLDNPIEAEFDYKVKKDTLIIDGNSGDDVSIEILYDKDKEPIKLRYTFVSDSGTEYEIELYRDKVERVDVGNSAFAVVELMLLAYTEEDVELTDEEREMIVDYNGKINKGYQAIRNMIEILDFENTGDGLG